MCKLLYCISQTDNIQHRQLQDVDEQGWGRNVTTASYLLEAPFTQCKGVTLRSLLRLSLLLLLLLLLLLHSPSTRWNCVTASMICTTPHHLCTARKTPAFKLGRTNNPQKWWQGVQSKTAACLNTWQKYHVLCQYSNTAAHSAQPLYHQLSPLSVDVARY
jgi:hypothetical protein